MNILLWIVFGLITGWLASIVMGTRQGQGWLLDIVFGIVGAVVGNLIFEFFGQPGVTGFNLYSLIVSVIGAVLVIYIGRLLRNTTPVTR